MATLTIAQLKDELKKQNVSFEDGKLKKYYVDLYTSSKRKSAPPTTFSDDEDSSATTKFVSPKARRSLGRPAPATPQKKAEPESKELDDDTLRQELTSRGHTPGPITASTRDLYRKMLKDSLSAETSGTPQRNASAPNTPSKRAKSKPLLLSDDEGGTSETDGGSNRSPSRQSRSSSATRRRSEIERLQLDNPGPRMADVVPDGTSTLPRSRRAAGGVDSSDSSGSPESDASQKASSSICRCDLLGGSMTRQNIIILAILVAVAISVVFALRYGVSLPVAAKAAAKAAKKR